MHEIRCTIEQLEPLTSTVSKVTLMPREKLDFLPGQYLQVVMGEGDKRPFSIANAPNDSGQVELHIGAAEQNPYAMEVIERMRSESEITIDAPHGKAYFHEQLDKPIILVAGGTGYSYTRSILQKILSKPLVQPVFLYWGTRSLDDMYEYEELKAFDKQHYQFTFKPVIENPPNGWKDLTGWVHKAVLEDFVSLEPYVVYLAGRFEMAGVAREDFHNKGLHIEQLFGDAYEFI